MEHEEFKIVMLGGGGSGKNEFATRNWREPSNDYDPTIEDSYRQAAMVDDIPCIIDLLDTSGKAEFSSMQDQWMREGNGYLIFYSIVSRSTFDEAIMLRDKILRAKESMNEPMIFVGTKIELEDQRQVSKSEVQELIEKWNNDYCKVHEISSKSDDDYKRVLHDLIRLCRKKNTSNSNQENSNANSSGGCCNIL